MVGDGVTGSIAGRPRTDVARLLRALESDPRVLAVAVIASTLATYMRPEPVSLGWLFVGLVFCLRHWPGRTIVAALLLASAWTSIDMGQRLDSRWPVARSGDTVSLTGRVAGLVSNDAFRSRFVLARDSPPYRSRISWYDPAYTLRPGDCVSAAIKLDTPHGSANPGTFDYEAWLWRERIDATGYVRQMGRCDRPAVGSMDRWRAAALNRLNTTLGDAPMRGIIAALALGARDDITDAQWDVLRATGTSHLVAISGLHIGLIAGWLFFAARWLALRLTPGVSALLVAAPVAFFGALVYALLAGFALPTQRALIMVAAGLAALLLMRRMAASRVLAIAAIAVVVWSPASVIAPGFWLSFGAVAWLIYLARFAAARRVIGFGVLQLGLVAGLAPVTAWFFGEASLVAPLVNAVLVPLAAFAVPVILIAVLLALVWPPLGAPLLVAVAAGLAHGWPVLAGIAAWPPASVAIAMPGMIALLLAVVGVVVAFLPRGLPGRWLAPIFLLPALLGWRPLFQEIPPGAYRMTVLDVGQGLAVALRTRHHTLLYDAGPAYRTGFDAGAAFVVPYLRHVGRSEIDRMIISHADIDHAGGAAAVERDLTVKQRIGAGGARPCRAGQRWQWDGVRFFVLYPAARDIGPETPRNMRSCVVLVDGPGGRTLLTGDIEAATEALLVERAPVRLGADVLVVAHHGSGSSTSKDFLDAVSPGHALISAGWQNRWGFPAPEVIERLGDIGAEVSNTASAGAVEVRVPAVPDAIEIRRWRHVVPRVWHVP